MLVAHAPRMMTKDLGVVISCQRNDFPKCGHFAPTLEGHALKQLMDWHYVSKIGGACAHKYCRENTDSADIVYGADIAYSADAVFCADSAEVAQIAHIEHIAQGI